MIVDRIGVLFELYAALLDGGAGAAFIGGSLVPKGGQNPMEPALFGVKVVHGPYMFNFPDTGRMDALGVAQVARDADELGAAWLSAVNSEESARTRRASREYFASVGGAVQRSWNVIRPYLESDNTRRNRQ
jgi:3-deoxy-D-manno-octulosonic-acid transferase